MRLAIASDHGGFELKDRLQAQLRELGHEVTDFGPAAAERCDYPDLAAPVARAVASGEVERGILVCGSGIGMSIAANKIHGVRAAVVQDVGHAVLAREHNDANVLCLGGRFTAEALALDCIAAWLGTECTGPRHHQRIARIHALEGGE